MGNDPTQALMGMAQQSMQNPNAQAVPPPTGGLDPQQHPILSMIVKALSGGMQNFGQVGMPPEERLQRQQLEAQKAETMARMAQTGAYQQGELEYRKNMADTAQQNADTRKAGEQSQDEARKTTASINQQKLQLATEANQWKQDIASGRLDQAKQRISNQASQYEQTFKLRAQQVGIEQAKLELGQQGMDIKRGFLDLAGTALNQKGTAEGIQAIQKLQGIQYEHPILSQIIGLSDVSDMVGQSRGSGMPGVAPSGGAPAASGTAPMPAPPIPNKATAKANQKNPPKSAPAAGGGVTHTWTPGGGIQPVGATQGTQP